MSTYQILRDQRRRDMIAAVEEWQRATGPDRAWWRGQASWLIGQWRCLHQKPERAAFQAAVTQSGIFRDHRCWKCQDGAKPCAQGTPNQCDYPMARNH